MKEKTYILNKERYNIIGCLIIFFIISLISIYSANTISVNTNNDVLIKQVIFYILGTIVLIGTYRFKNEIIKYRYLWYIGLNILLLFLLFFGVSVNGSKCWVFIGPFSFQPSEFMKLNLIIIIASLLSKYELKKKKSLKNEFILLLKILIIVLVPSILTFLEPDTGVVIIYFLIMITLIITKGINKRWYFIVSIILFLITIIFVTTYFFQRDFLINLLGSNIFYRMDRVLDWTNQHGYQLEKSLVSIGSAGLTGFGFNNIPLYFPEATTDFIFASFSSIFGFMGSLILFVAVIIFDVVLLKVINKKINLTDKYILIGIWVMIFYQQVQNIGMTLGLLPITGITLPFISYGGSSLLSYMFIIGIVLRMISDEKKYIN